MRLTTAQRKALKQELLWAHGKGFVNHSKRVKVARRTVDVLLRENLMAWNAGGWIEITRRGEVRLGNERVR